MNATPPALLHEMVIPTAQGEFTARYSPHGLAGLDFPRSAAAPRRRPAVPRD